MPGVYIVDRRYVDKVAKAFAAQGTFLPSCCLTSLDEPVCCHPDMMLCRVGDTLICEPTVFPYYQKILLPYGIQLVQGKRTLRGDYPHDVAYNILQVGPYGFGRWDVADEAVFHAFESRGIQRVPVAQGYGRCSTVSFGQNLITADPSIQKAAESLGLDVLSITPGYVNLPGYNYGFIGGVCGASGRTLLFFGGLDTHPDGERVRDFVQARGYTVLDIPGEPLTDIGTIFRIL
ncbi:MAG: hypothetical protein E7402_01185 [Ruminococcaceae bacterium]|nr:hypothetical protein [Oscillospiraceae bacterium]